MMGFRNLSLTTGMTAGAIENLTEQMELQGVAMEHGMAMLDAFSEKVWELGLNFSRTRESILRHTALIDRPQMAADLRSIAAMTDETERLNAALDLRDKYARRDPIAA